MGCVAGVKIKSGKGENCWGARLLFHSANSPPLRPLRGGGSRAGSGSSTKHLFYKKNWGPTHHNGLGVCCPPSPKRFPGHQFSLVRCAVYSWRGGGPPSQPATAPWPPQGGNGTPPRNWAISGIFGSCYDCSVVPSGNNLDCRLIHLEWDFCFDMGG